MRAQDVGVSVLEGKGEGTRRWGVSLGGQR